VLLLIMSFWP